MKKGRKDCPACGKRDAMVFETRDEQVEYKGHVRTHPITTWWCTSCNEGILEPEMGAALERAWVELRADVEGVLRPDEVKAIREKLGISQREASRLLGGGTHAFHKYETGETPVSDAMKNLLILLSNDPARLDELRAQTRTARGPALAASRPRTAAKKRKAR